MRIEIDQNNLLTIFNEKIPQTKEYTYNVSDYIFSDYDKGIIVLHKKEFKVINLKNLGDGMNVVYIKNQSFQTPELDKAGVQTAFGLFNAFDENTGKTYFFIPSIHEKSIAEKNQTIEKLQIPSKLIKTERGIVIDALPFKITEKRLCILFGLLLLYGKFEIKNGELLSIKIQLPLFGHYMNHTETLDAMIAKIQEQGIFIKTDKLTNNNGIIYQISSNDYELLETFAKWYEPIEKISKISKRDFTEEMKTRLIEFLETNNEIPSEGKKETIKRIKEGTIKFLTK